jgi:hypothetical protein
MNHNRILDCRDRQSTANKRFVVSCEAAKARLGSDACDSLNPFQTLSLGDLKVHDEWLKSKVNSPRLRSYLT